MRTCNGFSQHAEQKQTHSNGNPFQSSCGRRSEVNVDDGQRQSWTPSLKLVVVYGSYERPNSDTKAGSSHRRFLIRMAKPGMTKQELQKFSPNSMKICIQQRKQEDMLYGQQTSRQRR